MIKRKQGKQKTISQDQVKSKIRTFFEKNPKKHLNANGLQKKLGLKNVSLDKIKSALKSLEKDKVLFNAVSDKYRLDRFYKENKVVDKSKVYTGIVDLTKSGSAYIISQDIEEDVYVGRRDLNGALDKDTVKVAITNYRRKNKPEGKILEVLKRANSSFVGIFHKRQNKVTIHQRNAELVLKVNEIQNDISPKDGDTVVVELIANKSNKEGASSVNITGLLTGMKTNDIDMNSILINNGFSIEFPDEVIAESEAIDQEIPQAEVDKRRDMRDTWTITIDPFDAKDFDDAISYKKLDNGNIEIGVHIADVAHYVRPKSALDQEAYARSTSVYLVDRVCPMLPEHLSNGVCSLRPHEDKFTFSTVFEFNSSFDILNTWIGRTVTHSNHRYTYDEAQEIIDGQLSEHSDQIILLNKIATHLREERFKKGGISFETDEVKFKLDEDAKPIGVFIKERKEAHMLVEDFMLLANKSVAHYIETKGKEHEIPFVYRVHDLPDLEKLHDLSLFASEFGLKLNMDVPKNIRESFRILSEEVKVRPELKLLMPMGIRAMAKAVYTTDNIGHFGLGFEDYTHFTSPIRRYSDVLVHRILAMNLNATKRVDKAELEAKCVHISAQERRAMDAERESIKLKQIEYLTDKIGTIFEGQVSGFIEKGLFVELTEIKAEGLIEFSTLHDNFEKSSSQTKVTGVRSGRSYQMGQKVSVKLLATNKDKRQIELELLTEEN